ncbi:MAG: serine/threonine-protein phosphatase, partial [Planctomycetes bacterium]|nr:serine/threonine-protein phosphatase [Planctomycetota bacterium]
GIPNIMVGQLFNHGRELGAVAVVCRDKSKATRTAFEYLLKFMSVMAYIERIRTNSNRERQERDVFFAQSLTNRMVMREPPKVRGLRLGFEFIRNLDTSGDFFDFIPNRDGGLYGYIGCCSGKGLRTVLEVMSIMRRLSRDLVRTGDLVYIIMSVNDYLVNDKKRAHQASLCLFEVDPERQKLRVVKAGKLGILLFAGKSATHNLSTHSGMFLGMIPKPKIVVEEADFPNGSSLFCVTEGFYNSVSFLNAPPSVQWFMRALEDTVADRNTVPLAHAVFQRVNQTIDYGNRPVESMVAISVESRKRNSISVARNR